MPIKIIPDKKTGLLKTFPKPGQSDSREIHTADFSKMDYGRWIYLSKKLLSNLPPDKAGKRLLDVGCGAGFLSFEAKKEGYKVMAIDTSPKAVNFARKKFKIEAVCISLLEFPSKEKFDVVVLNHVLEHITGLAPFLNRIKQLLSPNGLLLIASPNYDNLMRRIFKERWYGLQPTQHVWQFTPETLIPFLEKNGFKLRRNIPASLDYNPENKIKKLAFVFLARFAELINRGDQLIILLEKSSQDSGSNS